MGKCFTRLSTRQEDIVVGASLADVSLFLVSTQQAARCSGPTIQQRRVFLPAFLHDPFAAWRKWTGIGFFIKSWWQALNRIQSDMLCLIYTRQTAHQTDGIWVFWVGIQLIDRSFFNNKPPYITITRCANPATTPRSCVIQIIAMPSSLRRRLTRSVI